MGMASCAGNGPVRKSGGDCLGNSYEGKIHMRHGIALAMVLTLSLCAGCGDSREDLAEESVDTLKDLVATLDGVKDEASAKSAKPELEKLVKQLNDLNERQEKLGMPDEAEFKKIEEKHGKEMEELQRKLVSSMLRIQFDPKIQAVLSDIDFKP